MKNYLAASLVTAFPDGVTYLERCLVACLVTAFQITCWDYVVCLERCLAEYLVTAFPVTCWGLEPSLPNPLAYRCSCQVGGLSFLVAACQVGGRYFLVAITVAAVGGVGCAAVG